MVTLWILEVGNARPDAGQIVVVTRCCLDLGAPEAERYGDLHCAYRGYALLPNKKLAEASLLTHVANWAGPGDVILSDGLARPAPHAVFLRETVAAKKLEVCSAFARRHGVAQQEATAAMIRSWRTGDGKPTLALLPTFDPKNPALVPGELGEVDLVIDSSLGKPEEFIIMPHGKRPQTWVASDISGVDGQRLMGYSVCRIDGIGAVTPLSFGTFNVSQSQRTAEAELRAMLFACRLAQPGDGIVCDILNQHIWAKIQRSQDPVLQEIAELVASKGLTVAAPFTTVTQKVHRRCHNRSRGARLERRALAASQV